MKNYVITIARENGSNGRAIGEALAGRLGIPFYNRDIPVSYTHLTLPTKA